MGYLKGKTALVTGSTSGLGRSVAVALAKNGVHVAVSGRDAMQGGVTVGAIEDQGGQAVFVPADLSSGADAASRLAVEATHLLGGQIDILINNAGIMSTVPTVDVDESMFDRMFSVNVKASFFLTATIAPAMAERGEGVIINMGSWVASSGLGPSLYSASKAALEQLTRSWAVEYGALGVRVNGVAPGVVLTEGTNYAKKKLEERAAATPAQRLGLANEIADAVVFLASGRASYIQGAILPVDGGRAAM